MTAPIPVFFAAIVCGGTTAVVGVVSIYASRSEKLSRYDRYGMRGVGIAMIALGLYLMLAMIAAVIAT